MGVRHGNPPSPRLCSSHSAKLNRKLWVFLLPGSQSSTRCWTKYQVHWESIISTFHQVFHLCLQEGSVKLKGRELGNPPLLSIHNSGTSGIDVGILPTSRDPQRTYCCCGIQRDNVEPALCSHSTLLSEPTEKIGVTITDDGSCKILASNPPVTGQKKKGFHWGL